MEKLIPHKPVMAEEAIRFLQLEDGNKVVDATIGCGGHSELILNKIQPNGLLIGIDRDKDTLEFAKNRLNSFSDIVKLKHANFKDIDKILLDESIEKIDAALFDLGISSYQLDKADRGFSFNQDGALDMRMDASSGVSAYDIVNKARREDLEKIIQEFGEEKYFRRITGFIIDRRKNKLIESTKELASIIEDAVGRFYRKQKIHPATRTFQALRIAVNKELESIKEALSKVIGFLKPEGRLCVISFHSLEDRIVKRTFREFKQEKKGEIITKKPVIPQEREVKENPRARSAKLRIFQAKS